MAVEWNNDKDGFDLAFASTPVASAAHTGESDSGWLDCGDKSTLVLALAVAAKSGVLPTLDVVVQTASDDSGSDAVDVKTAAGATFAQKTDVGTERLIFVGLDKFFKVSYDIDHDGGAEAAVAASGTLTSDATAPANNDAATLGAVTYTFKTALTGAANEVLIGGSAAAALVNLKKAINLTGVAGTDYGTGTVIHPTISAGAISATTLIVTAKTAGAAGNALASTETSAHLSFGAAHLTGGEDAATFTFSVSGYLK